MDFEMPAWVKRKSEEAPQSQGRRAVRQAVAEGGSEREVLRRLVDVLATLSLVNAAELRHLTSTVFKTYLVPSSENVAEAMAEAGRLYHDSAGAIKNKPEAERADAQEQLGPSFVYVWVAFLRSLASTKELGAEHVAVLGEQRVEERTSAVGIARSVLHAERSRAGKSRARKGGRALCSAWTRSPSPSREHWRQHCGCRNGEEIRPRAKRPPRTRSSEAPDTDAREIERLARRVEQHSPTGQIQGQSSRKQPSNNK